MVGIIHSLEAGGDFTRHLHNGDPLTARTTHVPAGRPKTGKPPFTWEQSAIDALRGQGLAAWKDWSVPGTLFQLEGYNGFGYRDHHPDVPSPYLWSCSNHYTRGKYVADGRFSPTAVSQQVGAALLLKQLSVAKKGAKAITVQPGPRVLQLANPHVTGPDVVEAQTLLAKNPYGSFDAGKADGEYGELTAGAVQRAKWELGYPANARDSTFGPQLKAFLSGKKQLPPPFKKRRAQRIEAGRLAAGDPQANRPVGALGLQERRPDRLHAERQCQALAARQERVRAARDRLLRLRDALLLVGRRAEPERGGGL